MCIKRKAGLSREEFQDYWRENHGALFMENAEIMRVKRYVQSHTITTPLNDGMKISKGMMDEFDGVAEVWFDSDTEIMDGVSNEDIISIGDILLEDEQRFIDHAASCAFIVNEIEF